MQHRSSAKENMNNAGSCSHLERTVKNTEENIQNKSACEIFFLFAEYAKEHNAIDITNITEYVVLKERAFKKEWKLRKIIEDAKKEYIFFNPDFLKKA